MVTVQFFGQQQLRQRLADDVGAPDHDRIHARRATRWMVLARITQPTGVHGTERRAARSRGARH